VSEVSTDVNATGICISIELSISFTFEAMHSVIPTRLALDFAALENPLREMRTLFALKSISLE
jgi:hypothetical protein